MDDAKLGWLLWAIPACGVAVMATRAGPFSGLAGLGHVLVGVGVVVGVLVALAVFRSLSMVGGQAHMVHVHGGHGPKVAADHEGGHGALARAAGGKVEWAYIRPDGSGLCRVKMPRKATAVDWAAMTVAGEVASGTAAGCKGDQEELGRHPGGVAGR